MGMAGGGAAAGSGGVVSTREMEQRQRILDGKRRLEETSNRLTNAQRMALESEQIGVETLGELHAQRAVIERADRNLYIADENTSRGASYVRSMNRRLVTTRIIVCIIIFVIIATIAIILYFKFGKKSKPSPAPAPAP